MADETWVLERQLTRPGPVTSVAWSPDGTRLATVGGGRVGVWDVFTGASPPPPPPTSPLPLQLHPLAIHPPPPHPPHPRRLHPSLPHPPVRCDSSSLQTPLPQPHVHKRKRPSLYLALHTSASSTPGATVSTCAARLLCSEPFASV